RRDQVGERHTLAGWVARRRDHGGLIFVDLRDETGICQLVVNPERSPDAAKEAHEIRNEFVLQAEGEVVARAPDAVNPNLPTGEVERQGDRLEIVSRCPPLPFQLDEEGVDETLRSRYRSLDLRRDSLPRHILVRASRWPSQTTAHLVALPASTFPRRWDACVGVRLAPPFPRLTWDEAQLRYGSDKPDLRFGLEIEDATDATRESPFRVFAEAP